jgi:tRNA dimethylallyltransferase
MLKEEKCIVARLGAKSDTRRYTKRQFTWVRHQLPDWTWMAPAGALDETLRAFAG